ncbi:10012_t:CDS:1, partial [Acaulospora colombiana]
MSSSSSKATKATERNGFIVINRVSHARYLPSPASHAFIYPTLSIYADVNALTNGQLSLGNGWLFGSGTRPWSRVTNIRPSAYLLDDGIQGKTLMERLQDFFRLRGVE